MNERHAAVTQVIYQTLYVDVEGVPLTYGFLHVLNVLAILSEHP